MGEKLKVLMLNGSPRGNGNIALAFKEMEKIFAENDVEFENILLGRTDIRGCIACETCRKNKKCVFDDIVNELAVKFESADGLVIGSPVYYGSANGTLMSALQRLFYSTSFDKSFKVGASVVSARRSGCTATFDELNKFFTLSNMPVATSQYWNNIYGWTPGEGDADDEGKQVMRELARNMVFLMKSMVLGKKEGLIPDREERVWTNFTRPAINSEQNDTTAEKEITEKETAEKAAAEITEEDKAANGKTEEEKTTEAAEEKVEEKAAEENAEEKTAEYPANQERDRKRMLEPSLACVYAGPGMMNRDPAQFMMVYAGPGMMNGEKKLTGLQGIMSQGNKNMMNMTAAAAPAGSEWTCECGFRNNAKFCTECGRPRPAAPGGGTVLV